MAIDVTAPLICDVMVAPSIPTIPGGGVSFDIELPGIGETFSARLCCKVFQLPLTITPPISLGVGIAIPLVTVLNELIAKINNYKFALGIRCPRE